MLENNLLDGFYRLIPIGCPAETENSLIFSSEKTMQRLMAKLFGKQLQPALQILDKERTEERKKLLSLYGYTAERINETELILYQKAAFLHKSIPDGNPGEEILLMLLADQDTLFTSTDPSYRNKQLNHAINAAYRKRHYQAETRRRLYEVLPVWEQKKRKGEKEVPLFSNQERELAITLLDLFYTMARKQRQSLEAWVKRYTTKYGEPLSQESLIVFLQGLLPEQEDQINPAFCDAFFYQVLPEYMSKVRMALRKETLPSSVPEAEQLQAISNFVLYKVRLDRLQNLNELRNRNYKTDLNLETLRVFPSYVKNPLSKCAETNDQIKAAILTYFAGRPKPLRAAKRDILSCRIDWAMQLKSSILRPVFLTFMTIICSSAILLDQDCEFHKERAPFYDNCLKKAPQRYQQLQLLDCLCSIFSVGEDGKYQNWREFLHWQGDAILSREEEQFWRKQLHGDYELLPEIGFQLCCLDYFRSCLPVSVKYLSYTPCSDLHLGKYQKFWEKNHSLIQKQAALFGKEHPELVKRYQKLFDTPKGYFSKCRQWLDDVVEKGRYPDMSDFMSVTECNGQELQRLLLETELQICLRMKARKALAKHCCKTWNWALDIFQPDF